MAGNEGNDAIRATTADFMSTQTPRQISDEDYEAWLLSVKVRLGVLQKQNVELSIFPSGLKKLARDPNAPCAVSIGPLHHKKHEWLLKDDHKWRYMLDFFCRAGAPKEALENCAAIIRGKEEEACRTYFKIITLKKLEMMEILLLDGCFLLELFLRFAEDSHPEDVLINSLMLQDLHQDLALLDNQIPFHILQSLFDEIQKFMTAQEFVEQKFPKPLTWYVLHFFESTLKFQNIDEKLNNLTAREKPIMHIIDMLYKLILSTIPQDVHTIQINEENEKIWGFEQGATKLQDSGIKLSKGESDMLDISFSDSKGVLKIPSLFINRSTHSIFRNLIAFEQWRSRTSHFVLSYAVLIKSLINSNRDVELLEKKGIIVRNIPNSGNQNVIMILRDLCADVDLKEFQFRSLCQRVHHHMQNRRWEKRCIAWTKILWRRSMVALTDKYFSTTWSILSVIAAVALLIMTALQTTYTLVAYYKQG